MTFASSPLDPTLYSKMVIKEKRLPAPEFPMDLTVTMTPKAPYVPLPVLTSPRSAWGKKMREKLDSLKATA
jgi:hypothetical protein